MTEEQKRFVEECEVEFKDRFTENDIEFMKIKSASPKKPPIIDPWYNKPRRQPYFWDQQNQGHGSRNHNWDRGSLERGDRISRHAGKHYIQNHNTKPY